MSVWETLKIHSGCLDRYVALQSVSSRGHDTIRTFSSISPTVLKLQEDNLASAISTYPEFIGVPWRPVLSFLLSQIEHFRIASFISQ